MKEYFISVIAVSLVGSIIVSLAPGGGVAKNMKLLCALCTAACIIFPLGTFWGNSISSADIESLFATETNEEYNYGEIYNNSLNKYNVINSENALKNEINQEFELKNDAFDVKMIWDEESDVFCISCVRVYIYPEGVSVDPRKIEKYISERVGCKCEFVYGTM